MPGFSVQVVDTTAAGDTFCGVLAATLARGADLPAAVRRVTPRRHWASRPPARSRPFPPRRRSTRCSGDPGPAGTAADRSSRCGLGSEHAAAHRGRRRRGAGPNGLVAATTLADAGWDVLVLEATDHVGGAVHLGQRGRLGQRPASACFPLAVASPVIRALDLESHGLQWANAPLPLAHPLGPDDDTGAVIDPDPERTAANLAEEHPADGTAWLRLYEDYQWIREPFLSALLTSWPPVVPGARLARRLGSLGELARFARFMALPAHRMGQELFGGCAAAASWPATRCTPTPR